MLKRLGSMAMAIALAFTMVPAVSASTDVTVTSRVTLDDIDMLAPTSISIQADSAEVIFDGEVTGNEEPTAMDVLVESVYASIYGTDMDPSSISSEEKENTLSMMGDTTLSGWVSGLYGEDLGSDYSWMFAVGKKTPMEAVADYKVSSGDQVWFYYADWMMGYRSYFDNSSYSMNEGDTLEVSLFGVPILSEMYGTYMEEPLFGAVVTVGDKQFTADEEGKVIISGLPAGSYTMTATWEEDEYGWVLVAPYATLEVEAQKVISTIETVTSEMKSKYSSKISNTSNSDVDVFWDMLAQSSLNGITPINIDFTAFDYSTLNAQRLAKVIIAMAVNNQQPLTTINAVELLQSWQQSTGEFNNTSIPDRNGHPLDTYANEQVFAMLALEIADVQYDQETAKDYLFSLQNSDGGFGYGTYSDPATTSWVVTLLNMIGENGTQYGNAVTYLYNNWDSLVSSNDSNSMATIVSAGLADKAMVEQMISASYGDKFFTWGESDEANAMATAQCSQALGDYLNGSIYQRLDDAYTVITSTKPVPPVEEKPNEPSYPTNTDIEVEVSVSIPSKTWTVSFDTDKGTTAFEAFDEACDYIGISYRGFSSYVEAIVYKGTLYGYGYAGTGLDGILYEVNGKQPSTGMGSYRLKDGDELYVYYTYDYTSDEPSYSVDEDNNPSVIEIDTDWEQTELPFKDTEGHWAEEYIRFCHSHGIMAGYNEDTFGPDDQITRSQMAAIIYRLLNK